MMRNRLLLASMAMAAFTLGALAPSAFSASHRSPWVKIFGHSTSCALGAASINDDTRKAGAVTENRYGCSHGNSYRAVPSGYLGARALVVNGSGHVCGDSGLRWNSTTDESITRTIPWEYGGDILCSSYLEYHGESSNYRDTDSSGLWRIQLASPATFF